MPDEPNSNSQGTDNSSKKPETFSAQYVAELRAENERLRKSALEVQAQGDEMKKALEDAKKASKEAVEAERNAFRQKLMLREIQSALVSEGFLDKDIASLLAPKVAEEAKLSLDEKESVVGLKEAIDGLKKNKPELFRSMQSTSPAATGAKPAASGPAPVDAMKLSDAEFKTMLSGMGISL